MDASLMKLRELTEAVDPGLKIAGVTSLPLTDHEFYPRLNRVRERGGGA